MKTSPKYRAKRKFRRNHLTTYKTVLGDEIKVFLRDTTSDTLRNHRLNHNCIKKSPYDEPVMINTSVPIAPSVLARSFTEKVTYIIDVSESKLSPARTLFYLSNLRIDHELKLGDPEITGELLVAYMSTSLFYQSVTMETLATLVILRHMGVDVESEEYCRATLDGYVNRVGDDILTLWRIRLSCIEPWALYVHTPTRHIAETYPVDTVTYKEGKLRSDGLNFIHVMASPLMDLIVPYLRKEDMFFNKELFESDMFGARNMFYYCGNQDNPYLLALFDLFNPESGNVPSN